MIKKIAQLYITEPIIEENLIEKYGPYGPIYKFEIYAPPETQFKINKNEEIVFLSFEENLKSFVMNTQIIEEEKDQVKEKPITELILVKLNSAQNFYKSNPIIINLIYGERSNE